jgi:hypothetical protein
VAQIAIGEDASIHPAFDDYLIEGILRPDGKAGRIEAAGELGRIKAAGDMGDLSCSESYHLKLELAAKEYIEVMEVSACSAQDENALSLLVSEIHQHPPSISGHLARPAMHS